MSDEENDIAYSADKGKAKGGEGEYGYIYFWKFCKICL